jgi:hypothetical protein
VSTRIACDVTVAAPVTAAEPPARTTWYTASHVIPCPTNASSARGRPRAASSTTSAWVAVRTRASGKSGVPGHSSSIRPSASRTCGGFTRTTVARTVSRSRAKASVCPTARPSASSGVVGYRATAEVTVTLASGENSVAGSRPSAVTVIALLPWRSGSANDRRTSTRPSR